MITMRLECLDCRHGELFEWSGKSVDLFHACPKCGSTNLVTAAGSKPLGYPYRKAGRRA